MTASNIASTMVTMIVNNPLANQLDLTCLRVLSCGGSPQVTLPLALGLRALHCPGARVA